MKKIRIRIPSGRSVIRYKRKRIGFSVCANCNRQLHGTPRLTVAEIGKLAKTQKRPSRAYGGYLCGNCTKDLFREKARMI